MTDEKSKFGRPTHYNPEIAYEICNTVAKTSKGLKTLCSENPHWPHRDTILEWRFKHADFADLYIKAKQHQIEALVDDVIEISDDGHNDTITRRTKDGDEYDVCNTEWVNRSRLRVESRKWLAAKLCPRIYGERLQTETKFDIDSMSKEELEKVVASLSTETKMKLIDAVITKMKEREKLSNVDVKPKKPKPKTKKRKKNAK